MVNKVALLAGVGLSLCVVVVAKCWKPGVHGPGYVAVVEEETLEGVTSTESKAPPSPAEEASSGYSFIAEPEETIWHGATLASRVSWENDPGEALSEIRLKLRENSPDQPWTGFPDSQSATWSASYRVEEVIAGLGPNEFVVHGVAPNGDDVFEHFAIDPVPGAYGFTTSVAGVGTVGLRIEGGGAYLPPDQRAPLGPTRRVEMYRGNALGAGLIAAVSPEADMLYVISTEEKMLWCIPRDQPHVPIEYFMGVDQAELEWACGMRVLQHPVEGNKLRIEYCGEQASSFYALVSDFDGDGILESHEMLSLEQYEAKGYPGLWATDYVWDPQYYATPK